MENENKEMGTDRQRKFLFSKLAELRIDKEVFEGTIEIPISEMTKAEMTKAIDILLDNRIQNKIGELRVKFALSGEERETKQENRKTDNRNQAGHDGTGVNLITNAPSTASGLSIVDSEGKTRNYTREQVNLLKNMIARGATDDQLKVFLYVANKRGLDPFLRQIYFSLRRTRNSSGDWESAPTIITGIDGFRVIADRTKQYDGIERQIMKDREGNELIYRDPRFGIDLPLGAWAVVYRKDRSHPFRVEVFTSEYLQTHKNNKGDVVLDEQWAKQPRNMIMKVAEAACLRMAFPEDLGGLYSSDEVSDGNSLIDQGDARIPEIEGE